MGGKKGGKGKGKGKRPPSAPVQQHMGHERGGRGHQGSDHWDQYDYDWIGPGPIGIKQKLNELEWVTDQVANHLGTDLRYEQENKYFLQNTVLGQETAQGEGGDFGGYYESAYYQKKQGGSFRPKADRSDLLVEEESDFCNRQMCGANRALQFQVHAGKDKSQDVLLTMDKSWHCTATFPSACIPSLRPSLDIVDVNHGLIGRVVDPWNFCNYELSVFDMQLENAWDEEPTGEKVFTVEGTCCQPAFWGCGLCVDAKFDILPVGRRAATRGWRPGSFARKAGGCEECCVGAGHVDGFQIFFPPGSTVREKKLLVGMGLLMDMVYFEVERPQQGGSAH